jgi:serine/threonine-protein kinase SRPK3
LNEPSLKKEVDGSVIYLSRRMGTPKAFGAPVLCDFGSAVPVDDGLEHREDIQPDVYRAPEVILGVPWTYSVDIWNVGCMVGDVQMKTQ